MFDLISPNAQALTMSSKEIAELTGKRHADVMRDIRLMLAELHSEEGLSNFASSYINEQSKLLPCFNLPKRESIILVSGYNLRMRAAIIDRWQQLEAQAANPAPRFVIPQTLPDALRLAAELAEQKAQVEERLAIAAPKAEALDRIAESDGEMTLTVAAKVLQMKPRQLTEWMRNNRWLYKRPGAANNVAYQDKIDAGLMRHKMVNILCRDGSEVVAEQALVTNLGVERLARQLRMH